jgi:hypothetical protein
VTLGAAFGFVIIFDSLDFGGIEMIAGKPAHIAIGQLVSAAVTGMRDGRFPIFQNTRNHRAAHAFSAPGACLVEMLVGALYGLVQVFGHVLRPAIAIRVLLNHLPDYGLRGLFAGIQATHAIGQQVEAASMDPFITLGILIGATVVVLILLPWSSLAGRPRDWRILLGDRYCSGFASHDPTPLETRP